MHLPELFREEFEFKIHQLKRLTSHGPSLGRFIEVLLLRLLVKYFPKSYSFTSGFIRSMHPYAKIKCTNQIDIICFDNQNYPVLFDMDELKVITPKSVKGLIEVKSTLSKNSIDQMISIVTNEVFKETDLFTKIYLIATKSDITPNSTFEYLKKYYANKPEIVRFIGGIYSLDWNEFIYFDLRQISTSLNYECLQLSNNNLGISPILSFLLADIYGHESSTSIINEMAPSLYKPINNFKITIPLPNS